MRGAYHILYPNKPWEVRLLRGPIDADDLREIVGGNLDIIPEWDQFVDEHGKMHKCIVIGNQEGAVFQLPFNYWATAAWHYVLHAKRLRPNAVLSGPIVIVYGDEEFMTTF